MLIVGCDQGTCRQHLHPADLEQAELTRRTESEAQDGDNEELDKHDDVLNNFQPRLVPQVIREILPVSSAPALFTASAPSPS